MLRNVKTVFEKSQPQAQMGKVFNGTQKIGPLQYLRSALTYSSEVPSNLNLQL